MINCFIISEPATVEVLSRYMETLSLTLKGHANTLPKSIEGIRSTKPDIVYVDIFFFKHHVTEFNLFRQTCVFVVLSDNMEDAYDAFEFQAFDYLLKPVAYLRFIKGIEKYNAINMRFPANTLGSSDTFFVKIEAKGLKEMMFKYKDLIFVEARQNYVILHIEGGKHFLCYNTMKEIEEYLPESLFTRVHKSYIINDSKITSIENNVVLLNNNDQQKILIGITYRKAFLGKRNKKMIKGHKQRLKEINFSTIGLIIMCLYPDYFNVLELFDICSL